MKYHLQLYIAGQNLRSKKAITNLKEIEETYLKNDALIEIIDVLDEPEIAMKNGINATPTIVKLIPTPMKKSIADLMDIREVLFWLGIAT
ncbi:Circadian clock protein KaiB [Legionella massiliensis]|uniref:Circadian clock protein KaiB n=1 Tax=Legionella massiliensis TaxID=1034943 RepID=A0A078KUZ7_9GAMM|nr:circadian clock KaiB family protein [Legionella massiliensis]CDZ76856.1 Circadian clock protein KaiB [Legionella massiliensis]CEE12594.1 Circadian clock protein KaiB [Legionella massiliensis]